MPRCWLGGSGVMVASGPPSTTARIALAAPHAFEVPGARGPIDASTGFHRHLRRTGADTTRRAAHQDRLSPFDPRVLEQHLPRGDGDDRKARRSNVVERGGLGRDLAGLDQRVLGIAADELVVCRAVYGVAERERPDAGAERGHCAADFGVEGQGKRLADPAFAHQPIPQSDAAAFTATSTSPAPGTGRGISSSRMLSMPPNP
jgi:hypothetical protein